MVISSFIYRHSFYYLRPNIDKINVIIGKRRENALQAKQTHKYMDNNITIREAQQLVDQWIRQYGVRYFSELTNMACLTEEVGELARIMARKYGDQSFKQGEEQDPADEMADVLWVLMCLANQTGVDLTEALRKNLEKKTSRDKTRHINNEKLKSKN